MFQVSFARVRRLKNTTPASTVISYNKYLGPVPNPTSMTFPCQAKTIWPDGLMGSPVQGFSCSRFLKEAFLHRSWGGGGEGRGGREPSELFRFLPFLPFLPPSPMIP